jgi:hypothetical protein
LKTSGEEEVDLDLSDLAEEEVDSDLSDLVAFSLARRSQLGKREVNIERRSRE